MSGLVAKAARHYRWARQDGLARLVEEDQLDPVQRLTTAWHKARWRRASGVAPGSARPVFVVGLQRSGTNMLVRGLERAPEVEVHNENDRAAFRDFRLAPDDTVRRLVERSQHPFVLFKPLCDAHRTAELLALGGDRARAVWVYRAVDDRVRSSVAKFGDSNKRALLDIAAGTGAQRWEAGGLTQDDLALLAELPLAALSAESCSALFWALRNRLFFRQGLDGRPGVCLVSYDAFVRAPEPVVRDLCTRLGFPYRTALVDGVAPRGAAGRRPLDLDPRVRALCDEVGARLERARAGQVQA